MTDYSVLIWPLQALLGAFCTLLWFVFTETRRRADKAVEDLAAYKVHVASTYITDAQLKDAVADLRKAFENYSVRLDTRLDRIEGHILESRRGNHADHN